MNKSSRTMIKPVNALGAGARLQEYEIRSIIGEGGFGIVYLAFDTLLEREVAIKEYLPVSHASRGEDGMVKANSTRKLEAFDKGLRSFVSEARMLARFKHPALVEVLRFWEENGTAYMVMPYYRGQTLSQLIQDGRRLRDDNELRAFLSSLLKGLKLLHAADCYHRDISTDNILMLDSGGPLLLDFGAARSMLVSGPEMATVILKPGFAPIEQYSEDTSLAPQGPWTDLYALCAVAYQAITGTMPVVSVARIIRDPLVPLAELVPSGFSPSILAAIDKGLRVHPGERLQSIDELESLLSPRLAARTAGVLNPGEHSAPVATPPSWAGSQPPAVETLPAVPTLAQVSGREDGQEDERVPAQARLQGSGQAGQQAPAVPPTSAPPIGGPRSARWQMAAATVAAALLGGAVIASALSSGDDAGKASTPAARASGSMPYSLPAPAATEAGEPSGGMGTGRQGPLPEANATVAPDVPPSGEQPQQAVQSPPMADETASATSAAPEPLANAPAGAIDTAEAGPTEASAASVRVTGRGQPAQAPTPADAAPAAPLTEAAESAGMQAVATRSRKAEVDVRVAPWGKVFVNGDLAGVAPPSLRLLAEPGSMHIEIRNESDPPKHFLINVEAGHVYRISHVFGKE